MANLNAQVFGSSTTSAQVAAAFELTITVTEIVRELGEVVAGILYAQLMTASPNLTAAGFDSMIKTIERTGLAKRTGDVIKWTGPNFAK